MDKDELLYHYFSNSLSKAQDEQLQELLQTDAEFKKQFEFESSLKRATKEKRHQDLKSKLNQFEAKINSKETIRNSSYFYLKIAASIIILVAVGWFGYQNYFGVNYTDLYVENYNAYPNTVYTITRSDTINSIEREAFVAYEAKDYKLALEKFDQAKVKDYFMFYKAQSHLKLDENNEAKTLFEDVVKQNKRFVAESYWYLGLINLKEKNKVQTLFYLEKLVANFDYKKTEARQLIKKLK